MTTNGESANNGEGEWVNMNYIPFGEKSMNMLVKLYQQTAELKVVIEGNILHEIVKVKLTLSWSMD